MKSQYVIIESSEPQESPWSLKAENIYYRQYESIRDAAVDHFLDRCQQLESGSVQLFQQIDPKRDHKVIFSEKYVELGKLYL